MSAPVRTVWRCALIHLLVGPTAGLFAIPLVHAIQSGSWIFNASLYRDPALIVAPFFATVVGGPAATLSGTIFGFIYLGLPAWRLQHLRPACKWAMSILGGALLGFICARLTLEIWFRVGGAPIDRGTFILASLSGGVVAGAVCGWRLAKRPPTDPASRGSSVSTASRGPLSNG